MDTKANLPEEKKDIAQEKNGSRELSVNQIKAIVAGVLVVCFALSTFLHSDFLAAKRYAAEVRRQEAASQKQAEKEAKEAIRLEEERQAEKAEKIASYKEKLTEHLATGNFSGAQVCVIYLEQNGESDWVQEQIAPYAPTAPIPSLEEGTYEANFALTFTLDDSIPGNSTFNGEIHYEVSPALSERSDQLSFTDNGTYYVTAYTTNVLGLESERVTYTYVLDKLIPNAVTASLSSGYFTAPVTVSLSQDQNFPIYYTLDGSPVTTGSSLYVGPFDLTSGSLEIRASGYSETGDMLGEDALFYYHITPISSGLEWNNMLLTSRGTILHDGSYLNLVVNGEASQSYQGVGLIEAFCEYQNGILYACNGLLYYLDLTTGESTELLQAPGSLRNLLCVDGRVFALSSSDDLLYLQDGAWASIVTDVRSNHMAPDGITMYLVCGTTVSALNTVTLEQTNLFEESDRIYEFACNKESIFYTSYVGDFKRWDITTGETTVILEYTSDEEYKAPYLSGLFTTNDGYRRTTEQIYENIMVANDRIYLQCDSHVKHTTIDYWNRSNTSTSNYYSYKWIIFNSETMEQEGTIDIESAPVIGDGYYVQRVGQSIFTQSYSASEPAVQEDLEQDESVQEAVDSTEATDETTSEEVE